MESFRKSHSELADSLKASKGFGDPVFGNINVNLVLKPHLALMLSL